MNSVHYINLKQNPYEYGKSPDSCGNYECNNQYHENIILDQDNTSLPTHIINDAINEYKTGYETFPELIYNLLGFLAFIATFSIFIYEFYFLFKYGSIKKFPHYFNYAKYISFGILLLYAYIHLQYNIAVIFNIIAKHMLLHIIIMFIIMQIAIKFYSR